MISGKDYLEAEAFIIKREDLAEFTVEEIPMFDSCPRDLINGNIVTVPVSSHKKITLTCYDINAYKPITKAEVSIDGIKIYNEHGGIAGEISNTRIKNIEKEYGKMELLQKYFRKEEGRLEKEHEANLDKLIREDEIGKIVFEANKKIQEIRKDEENTKYIYFECEGQAYTEETHKKLEKARKDYKAKCKKLINKLETIEAQIALTDNYDQKIKILKDYKIVGENETIEMED